MNPGRDPRTERTRQAVLAATVSILLDDGFERITIDSIADRSGVARSTIYRNWPSRVDLFVEAFVEMKSAFESPDLGNLGADVRCHLDNFARCIAEDDWAKVLPSLLGAAEQDAELKAAFMNFAEERRDTMRNLFQRAVDRGEIEPVKNMEVVLDRIVGAMFHRHLFTERVASPEFARQVANAALVEVGYPQ